jgi:hypothetical protein
MKKKHSFWQRNSLSIVTLAFLIIFLGGQFYTGFCVYNEEREENGLDAITMSTYLITGHFIQATFENWESEFLQMAFYVYLTIFLRQQGSAESKGLEGKEPVDREPKPGPKAPWPVRKGGWWLKLYSNSLTIVLFLLFIITFWIHFYGSLKHFNEEQAMKQLPLEPSTEYLVNSRFWFESFQNWQSEFLSVLTIVLLTVWLRQKGSPESKPVDAAHDENE